MICSEALAGQAIYAVLAAGVLPWLHRDGLRRMLAIGIGGLLALGDTPQRIGMMDAGGS